VSLALNFKSNFCNCFCVSGTVLSVNADCTHERYTKLKNICCKMVASQRNVITRNLHIELALLVNIMTLS
jgi:hypothetical protein